MTALTAVRPARVTGFERALLITAAGIDRFVAERVARRQSAHVVSSARTAAADIRSDALAMGAVGMLPR